MGVPKQSKHLVATSAMDAYEALTGLLDLVTGTLNPFLTVVEAERERWVEAGERFAPMVSYYDELIEDERAKTFQRTRGLDKARGQIAEGAENWLSALAIRGDFDRAAALSKEVADLLDETALEADRYILVDMMEFISGSLSQSDEATSDRLREALDRCFPEDEENDEGEEPARLAL